MARPAAAASLQEVTGFGNNPSNAKMFIYVPDKLAASPPILVAIHYCGGSASAYFTGTGFHTVADQYGFIVIYPQTTSSDGCFDVHSDATLKHDGGSDSAAIASMVRYTIMKYSANPGRIYVTGTSSGAMMTNVMLGAYPDLFRGGAAFAGVPYACFAGQSGWNSACANGQTTKTGQEWGDLVRAAYPGYTGPRPRVQLWHGDQDMTLNFHNFGEEIKEWTNVLGVSETPTTTEKNAPQSGWTRTRYVDGAGIVQVEAVLEAGMDHNLTVPANEVVRFFGLDGSADPGGSAGSSAAAGMGGGGHSGSSGRGSSGKGDMGGMGVGPGSSNAGTGGGARGAAGAATLGTGAAGSAARAGAGGNSAPSVKGVGGAPATSGSVAGSSAGVGVGGDGGVSRAGAASSSCSMHEGDPRGGVLAMLMMLVLGAAAVRSREPRGNVSARAAGRLFSKRGTLYSVSDSYDLLMTPRRRDARSRARRLALLLVILGALGCTSSGRGSDSGVSSDQPGGAGAGVTTAGSGGATTVGGTGVGTAIGTGGNAAGGASGRGASGAGATPGSAAGAGGKGLLGDAGAAGRSNGSGGSGMSAAGRGAAGTGTAGSGTSGGDANAMPGKFAGNITTSGQVRSDFAMYWDQITPENEGKWASVEGTRNQMNWAGLDRVHDYAKQHDIPFKQHNFVWGNQQPGWISGLSQADQRAEVEEWIRLFCERYPDTQLIDVVNEPPPHTTPPYALALGGAGASGYDWIVQSFKWARQYCPNSILILNDYNNIEYGDQNSHFISIVKAIQAAGAPIDAVGAQAHDAHVVGPNETIASRTASVKGLVDKLGSETGLPVYVSEYDIDEPDDNKQRDIMEAQFTMFWDDPAVKGITLWGYIEQATWQMNSGLMSSSGQQRPAMMWLMDFLKNHP